MRCERDAPRSNDMRIRFARSDSPYFVRSPFDVARAARRCFLISSASKNLREKPDGTPIRIAPNTTINA
ncbi:hypothetical protein WS71_10655 [Burkholderia mayonis]|uniref:Uncharacterized protein n=2 Tax=Burkholderia mayonis TaxID=1385591 RepID=A0A1B4FVK1_9BURK|nr:hypothetical protein WS71_10655 [Burkholderia mayonis]KVE58877.1 hypothetical protein WS71_23680 [Burkholderia mayonis]